MKNIIWTEWLKVRTYRTFWVMLLLAVIIPVAANFFMANLFSNGDLKKATQLMGQPFSFPDIWLSVASISSYTSGLFAILLIILTTNEYTFRTNRQNIIDGWDRREFVYAKLFWLVALSVLALVVSTLTGIIVGLSYGDTSVSFEDYRYIVYYFLQVLVALAIALLIAVLLKRAGIAIVIFLAYSMMIDNVVSALLTRRFGRIGGLLPLQAGDELLPVPLFGKMISKEVYEPYVYFIAVLAYICLAVYVVFRKMMKSDL
ncbi:ABC-2 family transporter protein [Chitinophaga jiangningensis]|uniref:ABC-2 family transporter protein n=1 Tax=Chitinophaga jiangningensis TaxID=1419482 RepID=A0A1M6WBK0_9BACT|nr:ABC transporter permease [Chitinophaga jiangningensis]SHK91142.1 ABC-2 family transporter protein [Chitinophaga jiangningensis]